MALSAPFVPPTRIGKAILVCAFGSAYVDLVIPPSKPGSHVDDDTPAAVGASPAARYPLTFTRVSSNFAARRLDPVAHQRQSHDGADLAALF
jgi:murein DD-endopeptidase MepM/ murein hydrolase activator NlpD